MNKQKLRTYLNGANKYRYNDLRNNCIKVNDNYIISDTFSLIKLNSNYGLNIMQDTKGLIGMLDRFENNYEIDYTFMTPIKLDTTDDECYINEIYMINKKLFSKINNVIKGNSYAILKSLNKNDEAPIIRLENTKTKEVAYMLPMRRF